MLWDDEAEEWHFTIVDVVAVLTESPNPRKYWSVLKTRLKKEGSELTINCSQLKMTAADGKKYTTDCVTTEQLFRLIQAIPSPKAEPFKLWRTQVAGECIVRDSARLFNDIFIPSPIICVNLCNLRIE